MYANMGMAHGFLGRSIERFPLLGGFGDLFEDIFYPNIFALPERTVETENKALPAEPAAAQAEARTQVAAQSKIETDPELARMRSLNELRAKLSGAIAREDFEEAITLRDKIRELEK